MQGSTYAVFRDDDTNSADYGKLFAYQVLTTDVTTTYMNGFAVSAVPAWAFTPAQDFSGDVSFSYEVADGTAAAPANATATITVDAVDDAPEITVPASVAATEDEAIVIEGLSITDVDVEDADDVLSVTLSVTDGTLSVSRHEGSTVTLTGTKDYINGYLSGENRRYHEDSDGDALYTPDDVSFTGGSLTQVSGLEAVTQTRYKDIYTIGGKDFIQVAYQSASDAGTTYEFSTHREVESTGMGMDKVWSFKDGGDTEVFDGTRDAVSYTHLTLPTICSV